MPAMLLLVGAIREKHREHGPLLQRQALMWRASCRGVAYHV